jgi:hypothetical protein
MTVWDSMALNAPHTEREIRSIHETGAGDLPTKLDGFPLLEEAIKEHYGQRCDEYMAGCPCCDTWAELDRLRAIRAEEAREWAQDGEHAPGSTTEPENATCQPAGEFGAATWQAILAAIAAEKAEWPHAGSMHDGARMACDAIAARIKQLMGDA